MIYRLNDLPFEWSICFILLSFLKNSDIVEIMQLLSADNS